MKPPASSPAQPATGISCRRLPLDGGRVGLRAGPRGFPAGVDAGGFTSTYSPVMPQDDRGRCARHPSADPGGGRPPSSRQSLDDPSRVDVRLVFYPLVTPLRRDDQGVLSDEASGFISCAACDRLFLVPNRLRDIVMVYCACNRLYCTCSRMYCVHYRMYSACYRLGG